MKPYFATFVSGCQDIIAARLQRYPNSELTVQALHDGLVLFESSLSVGQLGDLRFFHNVYELLKDGYVPPELKGAKVTVRARRGSQPSEIPANVQKRLLDAGVQLTAHRPDHELLLWRRDDGQTLWGHMLPRPGFKTRRLEPGELRSDVAHILGLVASLDSRDIVLDPFAGYGAIGRECLQGFHCQQVIAVEQNEHLIPHLKSIPRLVVLHGDARRMEDLETRCADRVITDPPWGEFEKVSEHDLRALYTRALSEIHRVLRAKGCAVILTSAPWLAELAIDERFDVEKQYKILVSGKKAAIYKLRKH